jgi:hypothetical protein
LGERWRKHDQRLRECVERADLPFHVGPGWVRDCLRVGSQRDDKSHDSLSRNKRERSFRCDDFSRIRRLYKDGIAIEKALATAEVVQLHEKAQFARFNHEAAAARGERRLGHDEQWPANGAQ